MFTETMVAHAFAAVVRAFFGNLKPGLLKSSKAAKLRFLKSSVVSISRFRWSRWPYTRTTAAKLDAVQRRFLYSLFPVRPHRDEPLQEFFERRHRVAGRLATSTGRWSELWATDMTNWHAHVNRGHDENAWSLRILNWKNHDWLSLQRLLHSAFGEPRTNTGIARGKVHRRWEEGIEKIIFS